jgi:hypothetical protein
VQTRSRAYKKNDQAWVEQKNGAIVRRLVGYGRLSGAEATKALAQLYASSRLYINFFQPSFKLKSKTRDGARVHKVYFTPATPCDRLLAHSSVPPAIREKLTAQFMSLDPVRLLQEIRLAQQTLSNLAAHGVSPQTETGTPTIADFVASLASAWKEGEALVEDSGGPVRRCMACDRGLVDCRAGSLGQGVDGAAGNAGSGRVRQQGTAQNVAAPCQGLAYSASEGNGSGSPAHARCDAS